MSYIVHVTSRAWKDMDETIAWLNTRSPRAAGRWHAAVLEKVDSLEQQANQYPLAAEAGDLGIELREALVGKRRGTFRVLFTIETNRVIVHHIRRASMDSLRPEDLL